MGHGKRDVKGELACKCFDAGAVRRAAGVESVGLRGFGGRVGRLEAGCDVNGWGVDGCVWVAIILASLKLRV